MISRLVFGRLKMIQCEQRQQYNNVLIPYAHNSPLIYNWPIYKQSFYSYTSNLTW